MDKFPNANNQDLYNKLPEESKDSIRNYRMQYFEEREKAIEKLKIAGKTKTPRTTMDIRSEKHTLLNYLKTYEHLPTYIIYSLHKRNTIKKPEDILGFKKYLKYIKFLDMGGLDKLSEEIIDWESNFIKKYTIEFYKDAVDDQERKEMIENLLENEEKLKEVLLDQFSELNNQIRPLTKEYNQLYYNLWVGLTIYETKQLIHNGKTYYEDNGEICTYEVPKHIEGIAFEYYLNYFDHKFPKPKNTKRYRKIAKTEIANICLYHNANFNKPITIQEYKKETYIENIIEVVISIFNAQKPQTKEQIEASIHMEKQLLIGIPTPHMKTMGITKVSKEHKEWAKKLLEIYQKDLQNLNLK